MAEPILNGNGINERSASPIRRIIVALGRKLDFSIKTIAMKHQNNIGRYHMWPTPEINSIVLFIGVESIIMHTSSITLLCAFLMESRFSRL